MREGRNVTEFGSCLLLDRFFSVLVAKGAILIKLVDANVSVNTSGDELVLVELDQALDIMRLASVQRQEDPLLLVLLNRQNSGIYTSSEYDSSCFVSFDAGDIGLQHVESLDESAVGGVPNCKISM